MKTNIAKQLAKTYAICVLDNHSSTWVKYNYIDWLSQIKGLVSLNIEDNFEGPNIQRMSKSEYCLGFRLSNTVNEIDYIKITRKKDGFVVECFRVGDIRLIRKSTGCSKLQLINLLKEFEISESDHQQKFVRYFEYASKKAHEISVKNGWWESPCEKGTNIALIHSELSEALEALRQGNPPDKHLPMYTNFDVELADVIIRVMDLAEANNISLGQIVIDKMNYNRTRDYKHGGKKF